MEDSDKDKDSDRKETAGSLGSSVHSFVIRSGRMTDFQKSSYEALLPKYALGLGPGEKLSSREHFGNEAPLIVEIGFGMGQATLEIAQRLPDKNFLGIEVHKPGIGKLMAECEARAIGNLRVLEGDAVALLREHAAEASIDGFHIFFPDPWPKKRHHKRRLVQESFARELARWLRPGGYLYFVTDWAEYAEWGLEELSRVETLRNPYSPWAERQDWRPLTKFERRGIAEGRPPRELYFVRA
jgi:tRNA (guanine-N7-)-methyltransferase